MSIQTINPATGKKLTEYPLLAGKGIDALIEQGNQAFLAWRGTSFASRRRQMLVLSALLRRKKMNWLF